MCIRDRVYPVNSFHGKDLPVSTFENYADGTSPQGTAAYEKRGVAVDVPEWIVDNCIQCNQCSYVCPHAVIRPIAMTDEEQMCIRDRPYTGVGGNSPQWGRPGRPQRPVRRAAVPGRWQPLHAPSPHHLAQ